MNFLIYNLRFAIEQGAGAQEELSSIQQSAIGNHQSK
jgi:hypothetical protein